MHSNVQFSRFRGTHIQIASRQGDKSLTFESGLLNLTTATPSLTSQVTCFRSTEIGMSVDDSTQRHTSHLANHSLCTLPVVDNSRQKAGAEEGIQNILRNAQGKSSVWNHHPTSNESNSPSAALAAA